jgi:ribose transport system permease protein
LNLLHSIAVLGILGLGMAIVVIGRGVDLSMVALYAVPTALIISLTNAGMDVAPAMIIGFALAVAVGIVNGVLVAYGEVPSLFVTLATGIGLAGIGQSGILKYDEVHWPDAMNGFTWLGGVKVFDIPSAIITFVVLAVIISFFLKRTKWGLYTYTIGDNPIAARTTGIPVRPILVLHYVLSAIICVIAGLVSSSSSGIMDTRIFNSTMVFTIVLVVVLGGIGLSGGRGGVSNALLGTLLVGLILNGMTIMNFSSHEQQVVVGIVLLVAILIDTFVNPRNEDTAQQGDI